MHAPLVRPSADEVLALWKACVPVTTDDEVSGWLHLGQIRPERVAGRELARALPIGMEIPAWARYAGVAWNAAGYRLLVPLYGPSGQMMASHLAQVQHVYAGYLAIPSRLAR